MDIPADIRYNDEMLQEAMDMLDSLKQHMGMFQRQYYGKLKKRFIQHGLINKELRARLNEIDTVKEKKGGSCCG